MDTSIWRQPGMRPLVVMTFLGFSGYAVLLPVAPLWAVRGGADAAGAGLVNGVLLLATVLTQLLVPRALLRFGWSRVLVVGMVLLGVPAAAYAASDALVPVLALSAVRGMGFGILTVTGSAAVAALVDPRRRGEAIGAYGLAVAFPNLVLLPAGPWLALNVGFPLVFAISALPLLAVPAAIRLSGALGVSAPDLVTPATPGADDAADPVWAARRRLARPTLLLLSVTLAGGAAITFAPQLVSDGLVASAGLLVMGLVAALGRWRVGRLADRHGAERFLAPLTATTAVGSALLAWSLAGPGGATTALFLVAMLVLGLAYGTLQNLTLVVAFSSVSRRHHNLASAVWNVGFDAGTAAGSVLVGLLAVRASFEQAFWVVAAVSVVALPLALHRPRPTPDPVPEA
ncbi:MFS transporter [Nocardioides coralli]|uniref:MFS transporter n=1 Tax=Nocardioides coralli TaxID=2872154 RepID=UPI001CA46440|nr:MFS transporter [Nocardioides coralli]QZY29100.1 MFS transporter [Nocardioides coralli]